jgi:hypothetical protein
VVIRTRRRFSLISQATPAKTNKPAILCATICFYFPFNYKPSQQILSIAILDAINNPNQPKKRQFFLSLPPRLPDGRQVRAKTTMGEQLSVKSDQ